MEREVREFISYLHNTGKTSYNTEVSYERDLKKLTAYLQTCRAVSICEVSSEMLYGYLDYMKQEKFACSSISRSVASIHALYQFLLREGRIAEDPSVGLKAPKVAKKAPEILLPEEIRALLEQPDPDTPKGLRDCAMMELLCATGLRVSELVHLKTTDLNLKQRRIVCHEANRARMIPIPQDCGKVLARYLSEARPVFAKNAAETMLFTNCSGKPMSRQGFWKVLKSYADQAGIQKDITPHTLRHSFAVQMLRNGVDAKEVQELMGHSDISTTMVYLNMEETAEAR